MNPINYNITSPNAALQQAMSGYQFGAIKRNDQQAQAAAVAKANALKAQNADLLALSQNPNAGADEYAAVMIKHPAVAERLTKAYDMMDKDTQTNNMKFATDIYAAVSSGNTDIAERLLTKRMDAAKNSGDNEGAAASEVMLQTLKNNPNAAKTTMGLILAGVAGKDKFAEIVSKLDSNDREEELQGGRLKKQAFEVLGAEADVEKTKADTKKVLGDDSRAAAKLPAELAKMAVDIKKTIASTQKIGVETSIMSAQEKRDANREPLVLAQHAADLRLTSAQTTKAVRAARHSSTETKKLVMEMEAAKEFGGGIIAPDKMFDTEKKLRDEYTKNTKNFTDVQEAQRRIDATQDNAAGDLALVFNYMKMLDPASVVRESEFATAQNAAGVPERVRNIFNKAQTGERLGAAQRKEFKGQAKSLFNAAKKRESEVRKDLNVVVKNYRLNPNNVFIGKPAETALPADVQDALKLYAE